MGRGFFFEKQIFFISWKIQETVLFVFLNKKNILSRPKCRKMSTFVLFLHIFTSWNMRENVHFFWGEWGGGGPYFSPPDIRENTIPYLYTLYLHYSLPNSDYAPIATQYSQSQLPLLLPAPTHNSLPNSHSPSQTQTTNQNFLWTSQFIR